MAFKLNKGVQNLKGKDRTEINSENLQLCSFAIYANINLENFVHKNQLRSKKWIDIKP
jgi:hypothetical protein